ncbi:hypothetical protein J6590_100328 [Homalodisca vitripennis]|nr:hypothetical protein J6590_100328 [Homalodisca vitripennis]
MLRGRIVVSISKPRRLGTLRYGYCICKTTPYVHYLTSNLCTRYVSAILDYVHSPTASSSNFTEE